MAKTLRTDESIVINRPLPEVFQHMTDPAHAMEWGTNVTDYKMLSGAPDEVGALASIDVRVAGAKVSRDGGGHRLRAEQEDRLEVQGLARRVRA